MTSWRALFSDNARLSQWEIINIINTIFWSLLLNEKHMHIAGQAQCSILIPHAVSCDETFIRAVSRGSISCIKMLNKGDLLRKMIIMLDRAYYCMNETPTLKDRLQFSILIQHVESCNTALSKSQDHATSAGSTFSRFCTFCYATW